MTRYAAVAAAGMAAILIAGCGGMSSAEKHKLAEHRKAAKQHAARQKLIAEAKAEHDTCAAALKPLMAALAQIDGRVSVGLNEHDYAELVGRGVAADGQAAEAIPKDDFGCYAVGAQAEKTLNDHTHAVDEWRECIESYSCEPSSVEPKLQQRWTRAEADLRRTRRQLASLATIKGHARELRSAIGQMSRESGK